MKFTVLKSTFMSVLTPAMSTVSNKNTIASIEGVLIETLDDGRVQISTYDMNKGTRAVFTPYSVEREGQFIINAQRLYQAIRVLPEDLVTIDINDKLNCEITCGEANFSIFANRGSDFPNLPDLVGDEGFEVSSSVLKRIIGKINHSIAVQDNRIMLTGAFFKISSDKMEVVSCDNYTLSKCSVFCEMESLNIDGSQMNSSFIIPGHAVNELVRILPDRDDIKCKFFVSRKHAIIQCEDLTFFTRTIESEYINYERLIPTDNNITVVVDRERILSGLERANIIAEEKIQGSGRSYVKLSIDRGYLTISSSSVNGKLIDEMRCEQDGGAIEIGFNCRFLINSIKASEGEKIKIKFKSATQAMTIEPFNEDGEYKYFYMILPVRMNENQ
jgi:DNA polymerase-3 subunit beta